MDSGILKRILRTVHDSGISTAENLALVDWRDAHSVSQGSWSFFREGKNRLQSEVTPFRIIGRVIGAAPMSIKAAWRLLSWRSKEDKRAAN